MRMLNPPHPGDFIRTDIIDPTRLVRHGGRQGAWGVPPHLVESPERQGRSVRRHGTTNRKGFWRQDGYAYAYAGVL